MYSIRPVSDLQNRLKEIEDTVLKADEVELKLDEADIAAKISSERHTAEEVFSRARERLH